MFQNVRNKTRKSVQHDFIIQTVPLESLEWIFLLAVWPMSSTKHVLIDSNDSN